MLLHQADGQADSARCRADGCPADAGVDRRIELSAEYDRAVAGVQGACPTAAAAPRRPSFSARTSVGASMYFAPTRRILLVADHHTSRPLGLRAVGERRVGATGAATLTRSWVAGHRSLPFIPRPETEAQEGMNMNTKRSDRLPPVKLFDADGESIDTDAAEKQIDSARQYHRELLREPATQNLRGRRRPTGLIEILVGGPSWDQGADVLRKWARDTVAWFRDGLGPGSRIAIAAAHAGERAYHVHLIAVVADEQRRLG